MKFSDSVIDFEVKIKLLPRISNHPANLIENTVRPPLYAVVGGTGFFAQKPRIMGVRVK